MPGMLGKGPPFVPGKGFVGVAPQMLGKGNIIAGKAGFLVGPGGIVQGPAGVVGQQQTEKRRAWSPHAGSRAIRQCYKGEEPDVASEGAKSSKSSQKTKRSIPRSSSSGHSSLSSKSSIKSKEKKKSKKKKSKKKKVKSRSRSKSKSSTISSSSSSGKRSRSRSRRRDKSEGSASLVKGEKDPPKESKEIEEAKMEALKNLTKLQSIEPKEQRAKEWRLLLRNWHPDKNPERVEVATAVFQFLQKGKQLLNLAS